MYEIGKIKIGSIAAQGDDGADFGADGIEMAQRGKRKMNWGEMWEDSTGMLLILYSELFGTGMAAAASCWRWATVG